MSKVTLSDDLNSYHSKALIRVKVKEFFSEFSAKIFELADEAGKLDNKKFEAISGINGDFYNEYCSQLKVSLTLLLALLVKNQLKQCTLLITVKITF